MAESITKGSVDECIKVEDVTQASETRVKSEPSSPLKEESSNNNGEEKMLKEEVSFCLLYHAV